MSKNVTQFRLIQSEAETILSAFERQCDFPAIHPVPIEMIASAHFGLVIESRKLKDPHERTVGALSKEKRTIYVDERCNRYQYRFAVAHEIGHWVMHECNFHLRIYDDVTLGQIIGSATKTNKKEEKANREFEANQFAAALLIPCSMLFEASHKHTVIDGNAAVSLAKEFGVSRETMLNQILDLSELDEWKGPHVDLQALKSLKSALVRPQQNYNTAGHASLQSAGGHLLFSRVPREFQKSSAISKAHSNVVLRFLSTLAPTGTFLGLSNAIESKSGQKKQNPQKLGKATADYLRRQRSDLNHSSNKKKPIIVEFAGTPNAGKDTMITILRTYLEDVHGFKVGMIDETVSGLDVDKSAEDARLSASVARVVDLMYEAYYENPGDCDFVIFNRGLFDRIAFLNAMCKRGRISEKFERINAEYLLSKANLQSVTILLLISAEESIEREERSNTGIVRELYNEFDKSNLNMGISRQNFHDMQVLNQLNSAYVETYDSYRMAFNNRVYLLDNTDAKDWTILEKARVLRTAILSNQSSVQSEPCQYAAPNLAINLPRQLRLALDV